MIADRPKKIPKNENFRELRFPDPVFVYVKTNFSNPGSPKSFPNRTREWFVHPSPPAVRSGGREWVANRSENHHPRADAVFSLENIGTRRRSHCAEQRFLRAQP